MEASELPEPTYLSVLAPSDEITKGENDEPDHGPSKHIRLFTMCAALGMYTYFVVQVQFVEGGKDPVLRIFLNTLPPNFRRVFANRNRGITKRLVDEARKLVATTHDLPDGGQNVKVVFSEH